MEKNIKFLNKICNYCVLFTVGRHLAVSIWLLLLMLLWTLLYKQVFQPLPLLIWNKTRHGIVGSYGNFLFNVWGTTEHFPQQLHMTSPSVVYSLQFLPIFLPTIFSSLSNSYPNEYELLSVVVFFFLCGWLCRVSFSHVYWLFIKLFRETSFSAFCPFCCLSVWRVCCCC